MANKSQPPKSEGPQKKQGHGPDDKFEWKRAARTLSFWVLLIIVVMVISSYLSPTREEAEFVNYSKYRELLEQGMIQSAVIIDREFTGKLSRPMQLEGEPATEFKTFLPFVDDEMVAEWSEAGIDVEFKEKTTNWFGYVLTSILPWMVLIIFWVYLMRRMQGGGARGLFSFGKSRAKLLTENKPKVTFEDVAGGDEAKEELQELIHFLKDPKKYQKLGGRLPKGALLIGAPGTGKTLMARAIAGEADVPFFSMSGADFVEMFVGVGASRVRDLFDQGKKHAPCIIFIDEIDAVGRQRGAGLGGGHDEREQTLNQLLVEMDGFESNEGVILIAATNRPDVLDPALLRPGRFDRTIVVDRPDVRGREGIFLVHSKNVPLARDVDLKVLAKGTPGLSGADIANLVNEAALLAARRDAEKVHMEDFENAKDKVMMGTERRSIIISDEEKKLTAYHEAGHVLVALFTPGSDPVHKVTIIPRGRVLGSTHFLPIDEKHSWAKKYIENKLIHLLGGRAAERLIFKDYTNGAASDIKQASVIARKMVCDWGMSEKIGPLSLSGRDEEIFLGREMMTRREYSDTTALEIDREIKRIVTTAQSTAVKLLGDNVEKLHALAQALLEREILDGDEIQRIIEGKKLPRPSRKPKPGSEDVKAAKRKPKPSKSLKNKETASQTSRTRSSKDRLNQVEEAIAKLEREKGSGKPSSAPRSRTGSGAKSTKGASATGKAKGGTGKASGGDGGGKQGRGTP